MGIMVELPSNPYKPVLNETDEIWANLVDVRDKTMLRWFVEWGDEICLHIQGYRGLSADPLNIERRKCQKCWQELQDKLAELESEK